ncbi:MAG TPA: hypothetical protein VMT52_07720 [Planctomycetota bacterium]|nr:hypothetical protein [Planctomycetota bacterium]
MARLRARIRGLSPAGIISMVFLAAVVCGRPLEAQLPHARLFTVFPPGGQQGSTFGVLISGIDLDETRVLRFSHPGITATPRTAEPGMFEEGPQPIPNEFVVTVKPDVPTGVHEVHAEGRYGVSNPRAFVVEGLPEVTETEPNNVLEKAGEVAPGTIVNGRVDGPADIDAFRFPMKAGERIIIDCRAQRIDSRLDATLVLHDPAGQEIDRVRDDLRRDPLLDFTAPAEGLYTVRVYDVIYGGSIAHFYRLSIGGGPRIDFILPPSGLPGTRANYVLYGRNLPGGQPAPSMAIGRKPLEMLTVEIEIPGGPATEELPAGSMVEPPGSGLDAMAYRLALPQGSTFPVLLYHASAPVILEAEPNSDPRQAQKVAVPAEVVGQFYPELDEDWVAFDGKQGEVWWIEVFSERLGLPTDPCLVVEQVTLNEKGEETTKEIQSADDGGNSIGGPGYDTSTKDPAYRLVVPANGTYRVMVRDLYSTERADPRHVWRLAIRREAPDFRLIAAPRPSGSNPDPRQNPPAVGNVFLRKGGHAPVQVHAFRRDGFGGAIDLSVEGLPQGVSCPGGVLGPGVTSTSLVLEAAEGAAGWTGTIQVTGKARIGDADVVRRARAAALVWPGVEEQAPPRSRLTSGLAIASSAAEMEPFFVEAGVAPSAGGPWEMSRAGTLSIPVRVERRGDFAGNVAIVATGLPPGVEPNAITLDGKTSAGTLELKIKPNAPLGSFTFSLHAAATVSYRRNPEGAGAAAQRKSEIEKAVLALEAASREAEQSKAALSQAAADLAAAAAKAGKAQSEATGEMKGVAGEVMSAAENARTLLEGLRTAAEKAAAEAALRVKGAGEAKARAEKVATDMANAAKAANIAMACPSNAVTFRITAAPIKITPLVPRAPLKQGSKIVLPVIVERLHGFAEAVQVAVQVPAGVTGLSAPTITIPKEQSHAMMELEAAPGATPGEHRITFNATAKFNDLDARAAGEVLVAVEAAPTAKG